MNITFQQPVKTYPYLAIWNMNNPMGDPLVNLEIKNIVVISLVEVENSDKQVYIQYLDGHQPGWFSKSEKEYVALPAGFKLEIIQGYE